MGADLAQLLRLKAMIDAAVLTDPDDGAVVALTDAYNRLWSVARDLVNATDELPSEEFERLFQPLAPVAVPDRLDHYAMMSPKFESQAKKASMLLRQLGGWFDGVIAAMTFSQRLEAEARAKAEIDARPKTGFTPSS